MPVSVNVYQGLRYFRVSANSAQTAARNFAWAVKS
jgi:hypothetical protein